LGRKGAKGSGSGYSDAHGMREKSAILTARKEWVGGERSLAGCCDGEQKERQTMEQWNGI